MPTKQRVRRHDGRDLPQSSTAQRIRPYGESAPIVISQVQASATQLAAKHTILFHQIRDRLALLAIHPAGEDGEHHLEGGRVDHGRSLTHEVKLLCRVGRRVVGHYGLMNADRRADEGRPWAIHVKLTVPLVIRGVRQAIVQEISCRPCVQQSLTTTVTIAPFKRPDASSVMDRDRTSAAHRSERQDLPKLALDSVKL